MRPYNNNAQTREDILAEFPEYAKIAFSEENLIKILELVGLTAADYKSMLKCETENIQETCRKKSGKISKKELREIILAEHLHTAYHIVWCRDNIENQLCCAHGWNEMKNRKILFARMRKCDLSPLAPSETVYAFIEMVEGGGYVERTVNGKTFICFDANAPIEPKYKSRLEPRPVFEFD